MTGLTWAEIAQLMGVSRRAVHKWAAGGRLNAGNSERLREIVEAVAPLLHRDGPEATREQLRAPQSDGRSLLQTLLRSRESREPDLDFSPAQLLSRQQDIHFDSV